MPDTQPNAVDDLKRRARRRLVGAIVLAIAAAIILPLFLESEPKPLGQDVQVQIPPIDNDRFISRLTPEKDKDPLSTLPAPGAKGTPAPAGPVAPDGSTSGNNATPPIPKSDVPAPAANPLTAGPATAVAAPSAATEKPVAPASSAKPDTKTSATASEANKPAAKDDTFVVQLAAYGDPGTARALERKLKKTGFPAYTEALNTSHGALTRVRVGPYATRDVADAARAKLKTAGQNGLVVPTR